METLLMCTPEGFAVDYEINPWMKNQAGRVSSALAAAQWRALYDQLSALAEVRLMTGDRAWPDLVFTANAGLPLPWDRKFILSNFRHPQRQGEKAIDVFYLTKENRKLEEANKQTIRDALLKALSDNAGSQP